MSKAKYRAQRPAPPPPEPSRRSKWLRRVLWLGIALGYMAVLWYFVFPWVDRTFVNRPAV